LADCTKSKNFSDFTIARKEMRTYSVTKGKSFESDTSKRGCVY
jgi:hypothetical protein